MPAITEEVVKEEKSKVIKNESENTSKKGKKQNTRTVASRPIFKQKLTVQSLQGQKIVRKSFEYVERSLFRLGVILRIIGEQDEIDSVNEIINKFQVEVKEGFQSDDAKLTALLNGFGIGDGGTVDEDALCEFTAPATYSIEVSSPQLSKFISLLADLDKIIQKTDTLWLMGHFNDKQRMVANYESERRLFRFAGKIIGMERRARFAAYAKGKKQDVEAEAPQAEQEEAEKHIKEVEKEGAGGKSKKITKAMAEELGDEKDTEKKEVA